MLTVELRLALSEAELLDACDDLRRLLEQGDLCPACSQLLFVLDDALCDAFDTPSPQRSPTPPAPGR